MLIQKLLYTNDFYNGIFCNYKNDVAIDSRSGEWYVATGFQGRKEDLICKNDNFDATPYDYQTIGTYIDFVLQKELYFQPTTFIIRGRIADALHNLKAWLVFGLNGEDDSNVLLYNSSLEIQQNEIYIFNITTKKRFRGMIIQNNGLDSYGVCYHVCISTFEVFGYVYDSPYSSFTHNQLFYKIIRLTYVSLFPFLIT